MIASELMHRTVFQFLRFEKAVKCITGHEPSDANAES